MQVELFALSVRCTLSLRWTEQPTYPKDRHSRIWALVLQDIAAIAQIDFP